ncbi:MAG: D-alanine--D-alanine ligase [Planctomycetota bacterium]|jgi:D-alanine-D-alanine ligase
MDIRKLKVAILFGGKSAEHEVSLQSARSVYKAIDKDKYEIVLIGIDRRGRWYLTEDSQLLEGSENGGLTDSKGGSDAVSILPGEDEGQLRINSNSKSVGKIDVVFPVLHGPFGEDGTVQGLLKSAGIPFVGAGVLGSAAGMDKDITKRLLRDSGLPIVNFAVLYKNSTIDYDGLPDELGKVLYVKPANLGSSVGISRAENEEEFIRAVKDAFKYDNKILVEADAGGREIECSVLGNDEPISSVAGEIVPSGDFYCYETKYLNEEGAQLKIPAEISEQLQGKIQDFAVQAFKVLCCEGMARVDFFVRGDDNVYINEINTIPGFTKISMYPKLWEASGIGYTELIDRLIELALERFEKEKNLKTER